MQISTPSGIYRYIPEHLLAPKFEDACAVELTQSIYTYKGGLRPIRARIEAMSQVMAMVADDLHRNLRIHDSHIRLAQDQTLKLDAEVKVLQICVSNSRSSLRTHVDEYIQSVFRTLQLRRRRSRGDQLLTLLSKCQRLSSLLAGAKKASIVQTVIEVRSILDSLPDGLSVADSVEEQLSSVIKSYRSDLLALILSLTVNPEGADFGEQMRSRLMGEYGLGPASLVNNPLVFWTASTLAEESLLMNGYISGLFADKLFPLVIAGGTRWDRHLSSDGACHCDASLAVKSVIYRLLLVPELIPAMHESLMMDLANRLVKVYIAYVFMSFCGSDMYALLTNMNDRSDLVHAHEVWIHTRELTHIRALVFGELEQFINSINRHRFRPKSDKVTDIVVAIESVAALVDCVSERGMDNTDSLNEVFIELANAAYTSVVGDSLAHAFDTWRSELSSIDAIAGFDYANACLVNEVSSFLYMLRCTGGGVIPDPAIVRISSRISRLVVNEVLRVIASLAPFITSDDAEEKHIFQLSLAEMVRDLQAKLASVAVPVPQTEWSLAYEYLQMLSFDSGELVLPWIYEKVGIVPLTVLMSLIFAVEGDDDRQIEFVDALEEFTASKIAVD